MKRTILKIGLAASLIGGGGVAFGWTHQECHEAFQQCVEQKQEQFEFCQQCEDQDQKQECLKEAQEEFKECKKELPKECKQKREQCDECEQEGDN